MNPSASNSRLGSEFDAFLFAPIGEDRNGLPLSIVSLLARMDLDPWQEAARLASLPMEAAAQKVASLLLPVPSLKAADSATMATRLTALLPRRTDPAARALGMVRVGATVHPRILTEAILFAIWLIWLLGMMALTARHEAPARADLLTRPLRRQCLHRRPQRHQPIDHSSSGIKQSSRPITRATKVLISSLECSNPLAAKNASSRESHRPGTAGDRVLFDFRACSRLPRSSHSILDQALVLPGGETQANAAVTEGAPVQGDSTAPLGAQLPPASQVNVLHLRQPAPCTFDENAMILARSSDRSHIANQGGTHGIH